MIEYDRKHTTMSQAPTSSLWTEDDDLTDEEEDQTLLGDDAYVEPVVPAEASRREDRRGLRVLAVVSLSVALALAALAAWAAAPVRGAGGAGGGARASLAARSDDASGAAGLSYDDWTADDPAFVCGKLASAAACDASGDGCSWTAFEQCYPLEDLGMDVCKALGEARCELATKCEWRNVTACMDASAAAGGDDDRPGADDFLP